MNIQTIIKNRRLELELTMKDVAKALGVSEATVSRYESGEIQNMGIDKIEMLAKVLRCSPGYLMGWEDYPNSTIQSSLTHDEATLLDLYRLLNNTGKQKLTERAEELRNLGYVKEDIEFH
jgi:transcriptional regulator with XRE-family HTH domain